MLRVLTGNGPLNGAALPRAGGMLGAAIGRSPFTVLEWAITRSRLKKAPPLEPPVFILGHWRSGTTHLYNILSKAPRFGFVPPIAAGLPWEFLTLGNWLRPLLEKQLPETRYIDAIPVAPDSPQEDEIPLANMMDISFFHGVYFPRRFGWHFNRGIFFDDATEADIERWQRQFLYYLRKLSLAQPGRTMLIKNPVYTARLKRLAHLFPAAKFIHIHRNPYRVFESTRSLFRKQLDLFALQPWDFADIEPVLLAGYDRMMQALVDDAAALPDSRFVEIGYDVLDSDPLAAIETIYRSLELDGFEQDQPRFTAYLDGIRGYKKNSYRMQAAEDEAVRAVLQPWAERWGYDAKNAA